MVYTKSTIEYVFNERNTPKYIWDNINGTLRSYINYRVLHNVRFFGYFDLSRYQVTFDYSEFDKMKSVSFSDNDVYNIMGIITPFIREKERESKLNNILK